MRARKVFSELYAAYVRRELTQSYGEAADDEDGGGGYVIKGEYSLNINQIIGSMTRQV